MITKTKSLGWLALAAFVTLPSLGDTAQGQQGPVRQGLRGAAEATGQAVRRTGEATRNIVGGVAQGTAEAARRTGEAARNLGQGTRDALRGTPQPYQGRYGAGYRADVQQDGIYVDEQYQAQPGYQQGQYAQGYQYQQGQYAQGAWQSAEASRGYANSGQVYQLRHDHYGREFICVNGSRVYFTNQASYQQPQSETGVQQGGQNTYEAGRPTLQDDQLRQSTDQATDQTWRDSEGVSNEAAGNVQSSADQDLSTSNTERDLSTPEIESANQVEVEREVEIQRNNANDESTDSDN